MITLGNDAPQHLALMLSSIASTPEAAEYYLGLVRPLQAHDRAHAGNLMGTLAQYLHCAGNVSRAARALYLHRSTLLHRLSRITSLTSLDLADPYVRIALSIGVLLAQRPEDAKRLP